MVVVLVMVADGCCFVDVVETMAVADVVAVVVAVVVVVWFEVDVVAVGETDKVTGSATRGATLRPIDVFWQWCRQRWP